MSLSLAMVLLSQIGTVIAQNKNSSQSSPLPMNNGVAKFQRRDLTGASLDQVKEVALDYTKKRFGIQGVTPEIILARPVTFAELPSLGLTGINPSGREIPLMLVILKGDIDVTNLRSRLPASYRHTRVQYVAYVFDLLAGMPTLIQTSHRGGAFRRVLNNPNLPEDMPPEARRSGERTNIKEAVPESSIVVTPYNKPYGTVASPITSLEPTNLPSLPKSTNSPPAN